MEPKKHSFLRKIRKKYAISGYELARRLGLVKNTISLIEYKRISCGELMSRRLGEFFNEDWKKFLSKKDTNELH